MNTKQIIQFFNKNGFKLRPDSFNLIKQELPNVDITNQQLFLKQLIKHIRKILLDKVNLSSSMLEKDLINEAIIFQRYENQQGMEIEDEKISKEMEAFNKCLIIDDIFKDFQLFNNNSDQNLVQKKYEYFTKLIEDSSDYFYSYNQDKNLNHNAKKLDHVGDIKGKDGYYYLMGVIFSKNGKYFLQDTIADIRLNLNKCKPCNFYCSYGHIVLVEGTNSNNIFNVEKIECINIPYDNTKNLIEKYKQIFYDNFTQTKQLTTCYQKFFNIQNEDVQDQNQYVSLFSNFNFNNKNFDLLEKYLCLKVSSPPLVIILMGNFFDFYPIDHTKKMNKVNQLCKQFRELIKHYKDLLKFTKIFLVPNKMDAGDNQMPRKEISQYIIRNAIEKVHNVFLVQNPFNFFYKQKTFTILRCDQITINLRDSIIKQQEDQEPYQLIAQTILGQRDLLPNQGDQIQKLKDIDEKLILKDLPNYLILGENCAPENIYQVNQGQQNIIFTSNFNLTNQYTEINFLNGEIRFDTIEQLYQNLYLNLLTFFQDLQCQKIPKLMNFQQIKKQNNQKNSINFFNLKNINILDYIFKKNMHFGNNQDLIIS